MAELQTFTIETDAATVHVSVQDRTGPPPPSDDALAALVDVVRNIDPDQIREQVAARCQSMASDPVAAAIDAIADTIEATVGANHG
jgi:hypothetical protein